VKTGHLFSKIAIFQNSSTNKSTGPPPIRHVWHQKRVQKLPDPVDFYVNKKEIA
jgi:hypothetical protein